ncbi:hypothetical protein PMAC_002597 [Pneumocystis sp. 'macacae']|nr:hypothetical protein PMAC_002597 [Pneumocystis sp. 'macacae']
MIKLENSALEKLKKQNHINISTKTIDSKVDLQKDIDLDRTKNNTIEQKRKSNIVDETENNSTVEIVRSSADSLKRRKLDLWDTEQLLEYPKNKTIPANLDFFDTYDANCRPKQTEYLSILPTIDKIMKTEEEIEHAMTNEQFQWIIDGYRDGQYEQHSSQRQQKVSAELRAGEATTLKLPQMAEMGLFELGDMWKYSRTLGFKQRGKGRDKIEIRKDLQLTGIDESTHSLTFLCPSSTNIYFMEGDPGISISNITTPTMLETQILDIDGRTAHSERPNGNAWKSIRVQRRGQDMGTLFEVRMKAFDLYGV